MKWMNKMERKIGKYAINNLMLYITMLYTVGFVLIKINPTFYFQYLSLNAQMILRGQIWRLVTFLIYPPSTRFLYFILAAYLYYSLGMTLERVWGTFRFNLYFFSGILFHIIAALLLYLITPGHQIFLMTTEYLNWSLFFAFALTFPDMEFLLFFLIPVKAKWMGIIDGIFFLIQFIMGGWEVKIMIFLCILNFLIFFFSTRNMSAISPKAVKRRMVYKSQVREASVKPGQPRHRCAVCGQTEFDDENLEFRFCSKCEGSYEYCQNHLYTHVHVTKGKE